MTKQALIGILLIFSLSGCVEEQHSYYLSPTNSNSVTYHPMPLKSDSIRSAFYADLGYTTGAANQMGHDYLWSLTTGIHRTQSFGIFEAYYGANISMGRYHVADFYNSDYEQSGGWFSTYIPYDTFYHVSAISEFFGYYNISGGINIVVIPHDKSGEWRALGFETSIQKEFGNYANFRKTLSDSAANVIFRKTVTTTAGFYTDVLWETRNKMTFGFKLAGGWIMNPQSDYTTTAGENIFPLTYVSFAFHGSKSRYNSFIQLNFGKFANNFQAGISYRFGEHY